MDDTQKRLADLEDRVKKLEESAGLREKDVIFEDVVKLVVQYEEVSASMLQRRFSVGYARAARLLDQLEDEGYIEKGEGARPRRVLKNIK